MASLKKYLGAVALFSCMSEINAGFNPDSYNNVAVYWGQNSRGTAGSQLRLSHYCDSPDVDVFMLSFVVRINGIGGVPQVNWANQGDICKPFPGTDLLYCPQIGEDIKTCQAKGKTILLSIGGATYNEGGFRMPADAVKGANMIWEIFGPPKANSTAVRPFDDAVVDGIDLDFEAVTRNMIPFSNELRRLWDADTSKPYYLTAAPQCPYPDMNNKELLEGGVIFDALFIQFYNNYCGVNSWTPNSDTQNNFNFNQWENWAKTISKNKKVKVMVGAPANAGAGAGYVSAQRLAQIATWCKRYESFGGVMLWDASQAWANSGFIATVKKSLGSFTSRFARTL
ncbi:hypothetical protein FQN57_002382 [Myotisia sp. PD_48]|nr:hypothetical protein FQN57_002382 [Myotisia sp. PD_48]